MATIIKVFNNCRECGKSHNDIEVKMLVTPRDGYTHYVKCPNTKKRVLLKEAK